MNMSSCAGVNVAYSTLSSRSSDPPCHVSPKDGFAIHVSSWNDWMRAVLLERTPPHLEFEAQSLLSHFIPSLRSVVAAPGRSSRTLRTDEPVFACALAHADAQRRMVFAIRLAPGQ